MSAERSSPDRGGLVWVLFLAGPVIWFLHFIIVYLMVEAGCAADRYDAELAGLPALSFVTVALTVVATAVALELARRARRMWRARATDPDDWLAGDDRNAGLALAGALLGVMSAAAILFVGVPAVVLQPC